MKNIIFRTNSKFRLHKDHCEDDVGIRSDELEPTGDYINNHTDLLLDYCETYDLDAEFSLLELAVACYKIKARKFIFSYEIYSYVEIVKSNKKYEIEVYYSEDS
jgi:hypothetical protein